VNALDDTTSGDTMLNSIRTALFAVAGLARSMAEAGSDRNARVGIPFEHVGLLGKLGPALSGSLQNRNPTPKGLATVSET
jgi:hypothetical protein